MNAVLAPFFTALSLFSSQPSDTESLPDGFLMYHSYSSYEARDSRLYVYNTGNGKKICINDCVENIYNLMNGDFGPSPYDIVFMGMTENNENAGWDIFRFNIITKELINLTNQSDLREEDVKFSPSGNSVVFKRGKWNHQYDTMQYDIHILDLKSGQISQITDDIPEDSMPYFSDDGNKLYYMKGTGKGAGIYSYDISSKKETPVYIDETVMSYYPVVYKNFLFFTRHVSEENMNDCIYRIDTDTMKADILDFCTPDTNFSDPAPIDENNIIYSSTANGSYDLFVRQDNTVSELSMLNTPFHELGAVFYNGRTTLIENFTSMMLAKTDDTKEYYDINSDGMINISDYCLMKNYIYY